MDAERAAEIAAEWRRGCRFDPDTQGHVWAARTRGLTLLLADTVPDFELWAVYPVTSFEATTLDEETSEHGAAAPALAGISDGALYRIALQPTTPDGAVFKVSRDVLTALHVSLVERLEEELGGVRIRHRGWVVAPDRGDIFGIVSQETLEGPTAGPPPVEQLARAIARGAGWSL